MRCEWRSSSILASARTDHGYESRITPFKCARSITAALVDFAGSDYIKEWLATIVAVPATLSRAEYAAMIKRDIARWGRVVREAGVEPL